MILVDDCLKALPTLPAHSFDSIVTDPPYGLGFMGKAWDHGVPGAEFWREMLRVAKPGAYLAAFGGTRTFHRLACAIEDAGWELRDTLMWVYGSGFPKSHNGEWGGTALKPAWEPIVLARKPLHGTVAANFARYGTGGLNIDGCRVEGLADRPGTTPPSDGARGSMAGDLPRQAYEPNAAGRWPANLIHDGSEEALAAFPDATGQKADILERTPRRLRNVYEGGDLANTPAAKRGDTGSAARFFYCAKASVADREDGCDQLQARAFAFSNGARDKIDKGTAITDEGSAFNRVKQRRNTHPTVKPTELMRWLCRLVTPAGGHVLDPFAGSGSTGRGALLEGMRFTGIELDPDYARIALARLAVCVKPEDLA